MPLRIGKRFGTRTEAVAVRVTKCSRGFGVAGASVMTLCLAWCSTSGLAAAGPVSTASVVPAAPGQQLWASTMGACCGVGAVSPDGTTVFASGYVKSHFETVAYDAATGAQLWAASYQAALSSNPTAITVSPDGARVYVSGRTHTAHAMGDATVAYDARTGKQLWASRYIPKGGGAYPTELAVSPDGTFLYVAGSGWGSARRPQFAVIGYDAATGAQRWAHWNIQTTSAANPGYAASVAVSPDGTTVYATGAAGSLALTVAYRAAGTLMWAVRYQNPYGGFAALNQVVAGPGGGAVYVTGRATNKYGHVDMATFAYRAATGTRIWLRRANLHLAEFSPAIAVTPGEQTVIATAPRNGDRGPYAIAAYNASTGRTRWSRLAPDPTMFTTGLVISPHGEALFVGGSRTAAYSVANGTVLWITSGYALGEDLIGVSSDGTRLFATRPYNSGGMATVAYQT